MKGRKKEGGGYWLINENIVKYLFNKICFRYISMIESHTFNRHENTGPMFSHVLDAIICSLVLSEKLSHEPLCHFKYFPIVLDTKCAIRINRKGICNGHVLVHCWKLPIKAQGFYQISYSLLVFIWILTAVSLGVDMVVPGEVWVLCWLENVGYFQSEQQDKTLAYWFTLDFWIPETQVLIDSKKV